jgi:hypothetical protein
MSQFRSSFWRSYKQTISVIHSVYHLATLLMTVRHESNRISKLRVEKRAEVTPTKFREPLSNLHKERSDSRQLLLRINFYFILSRRISLRFKFCVLFHISLPKAEVKDAVVSVPSIPSCLRSNTAHAGVVDDIGFHIGRG